MKNKIERAKHHLQDNKTAYIVGGVCIVVAFGGGAVFGVKQIGNIELSIVKWHSPTTVNQTLIRRMHPGYKIRVNETGEEFASIRRTAEVLGVDPRIIRNYFAGKIPDVSGMTLTNLGEMTS